MTGQGFLWWLLFSPCDSFWPSFLRCRSSFSPKRLFFFFPPVPFGSLIATNATHRFLFGGKFTDPCVFFFPYLPRTVPPLGVLFLFFVVWWNRDVSFSPSGSVVLFSPRYSYGSCLFLPSSPGGPLNRSSPLFPMMQVAFGPFGLTGPLAPLIRSRRFFPRQPTQKLPPRLPAFFFD